MSLLFFLSTASCVSSPLPKENRAYERTFKADFDQTWRACQQAIISYPLKVNNMEQGTIQSTILRSHVYFKPPHVDKKHAGGYRYELSINLIKETETLTKVSIEKKLQMYRDFISTPESLISDGLEESSLLYRIEREIEIDRELTAEIKKKSTQKK